MNVLLPVDHSVASDKAVEFTAKVLGGHKGNLGVTLLHVAESIPDFLLAGGAADVNSDAYRKVASDSEAEHRATGTALLEKHRRALVAAGLSEASVETKLVVRECRPESSKVVATLSIIEEMKSAEYSIVCLGRRGATAAAGSFLGSVAEKVLREAEGRTVWVVD